MLKFARAYGYNIYVTRGDTTVRIQARADIVYAGKFMDDHTIFHLNKSDIYLNQREPDEHSYRLASACSKAIYPVTLVCDKYAEILGIRHDRAKEQWRKSKPYIEREFGGECAKRYIEATEQGINDARKVVDIVKKDLFFQTFFVFQYQKNMSIEREVEFELPLIPFHDSLQIKAVRKGLFAEDKKSVCFKGLIADERIFDYEQILRTQKDEGCGIINGEVAIKYGVAPNVPVDNIFLDVILTKENLTSLMHVKMEAYYLPEYPLQIIEDKDTILLGQEIEKEQRKNEKAKRKQKSLWERFMDYLNEPL